MLQKSLIALSIEAMMNLKTYGMDIQDASMCWVKEPTSGRYEIVRHDEYCYEMGCLGAVPAYTLEDIMMKIKGTLDYNNLIEKKTGRDTAWTYTIQKNDHASIEKGIFAYGRLPLEAAYHALVHMQKKYPDLIATLPNSFYQEYVNRL